MAGIPLNGRQAKKSVSDGRGTGASRQRKGREGGSTREKLKGRTGGGAEPISCASVSPSGARWGSGKEGVLHALLGDR